MNVSAASTVIRTLVSRVPGRFSSELGLNLPGRREKDLFLWFLAALLYGARISGSIVAKTHAEFVRRGLTSPEAIVKTGWEGLVEALDAGGYARYDFKTATKLLEVMKHLIDEYGGDLQRLHDACGDAVDLERRLKSLGKGIGEVTIQIFLRELRDIWPKAQPTLSPLSVLAMNDLALCSSTGSRADRTTVDLLRTLWKRSAVERKSFSDFESALVRLGRDYCRRHRKRDCPMREFCTSQRMGRSPRGGRYGRGGDAAMIDKYSFGSITIDGRTYDTDVIIYPERIDDRWWRKEGHWLQLADLGGVHEAHPSVLVVGTGYFERMYVDPAISDWLQQQGITLIACDTTRACAEFNRLKETRKVVAVLHLAC